jgi:ATPase subunit of ABC transporter with duplicated ATPase domains
MIRVLLKNPEYIILDEPTNNLDMTTKQLLKKNKKLSQFLMNKFLQITLKEK